MPFAASGIGAAVAGGLASGVATSLLSPSSSGGGGGGSYYVPTGLQGADQQWQDLQNANIGLYSSQTPYLAYYGNQSLNQGYNALGNYGGNLQLGADTAGAQYGVLGGQLQNAANQQLWQQQGLIDAGRQVYNTALDPQSALYNRTVQQLQDQTGATNSMYGLGSSAAGAGVANQALGNFNIDWQNQQLQRQLQGLQGYGSAVGQAGQTAAQGGALGAAGAGYTLQGAQTPFQTAQGLAAVPGQLGGQYGQYLQNNIYGPAQGFQSQAIPYMNAGIGAQAVPYQAQAQGAGAAGALLGQGVGQAAQGLGNAFQNSNAYQNWMNPASGSFSGGDFSGAFTGSPYYSGGGNSYGFTM